MFFFRSPRLPVSPEEREWIDTSLERLISLFGEETFRRISVRLPKDNAFPEWDGTEACVAPLLARVCDYMLADPTRLRLVITPDEQARMRRDIAHLASDKMRGAAGTYSADPEDGTTITVKETLIQEPIALIGTLAHEVSHVRLLGERLIDRDEENMEPLTDLCTVFWGLGIFTANSAFRFHQHGGGWSIQNQGYLSEEMWGYALAAWAHRRGDRDAKWSRHLGTNVRAYFSASQNCLRKETSR